MAAIKELPLQTDILVKSIPPFACLTDAAWKKQGLWAILTTNPNSWDTAAFLLLPHATDDIILLQETNKSREVSPHVPQRRQEERMEPSFELGDPHSWHDVLCGLWGPC